MNTDGQSYVNRAVKSRDLDFVSVLYVIKLHHWSSLV
jgi:hypothetical protein